MAVVRIANPTSCGWVTVERSLLGECAYLEINNPVARDVAKVHLSRDETLSLRDKLNAVLADETIDDILQD